MFGEDRYFISCEGTPSPDHLLTKLAIMFSIPMVGNVLKALLLHLQNSPCLLLVLDNFETVWEPPDSRSQVESLLTEIASIGTLTLIMTMRGSQRPLGTRWSENFPPLKPLDVQSAMAIFEAICCKSDNYSRRLVEAVDCIPLAVTLIATLASVDGESTEVLWLRWQKELTSMVQQGEGRSNNLDKSIELSISSPRMQCDAGALVFLSVLSMLPDGMSAETIKFFDTYIPDKLMVYKAISTLRQNALIYEDTSNNIRVLNPIRLFVRNRHPPPRNVQAFLFGYFISLALQGTSYTDSNIRFRLERESGNINAILLEALDFSTAENLPEIIQATINFSHYAYVSGKASVQAISRAIDKLQISSLPMLGANAIERGALKQTSRRGLGGRLYIPISYFVKPRVLGLEVNKELRAASSASTKLRADCLGCLGQLLSQQSKFALAKEKFQIAKKLHAAAGDVGGCAYDTLNHGLIMAQNEEGLEDAMKLFTQAIALHENVGDLSGKAYDQLAAGGTLRELYRFGESEKMFSEAASLFFNLQDTLGQAAACNGLGTISMSRSQFCGAEKYLNDAAKLSADAGDILGQAESISGLATVSLLLSRLNEAQDRINHAISLRDPYEDPDHLHILGRIFIGKEDWKQATVILSRALIIHQDVGDVRGEAEDLCYLASVQYSQGNYSITQELACRALAKNPGKATTAQIRALYALILICSSLTCVAKRELEWLLAVYQETHDFMGQAHTVYLNAMYYVNLGDFEDGKSDAKRALELYNQVGHRKGKGDALNLIAWTLSMQRLDQQAVDTVETAMEIYTDLGYKSGQGSCLFVRATILLSQLQYEDAYSAIIDALSLHESSNSKYGKARDLALLSNILWSRQHGRTTTITKVCSQPDGDGDGDGDESDSDVAKSLSSMEKAIELFKELGCFRQMYSCIEQKRQMEMPSSEYWKPSVIPVF